MWPRSAAPAERDGVGFLVASELGAFNIELHRHFQRADVGVCPGYRGDILGYVGTTGNTPANTPHLHFAIFRLGPEKRWWAGAPVNPYAVFTYP